MQDKKVVKTNKRGSKPRSVELDHKIGARIKEKRVNSGLSQQQLAEILNITYQQEHKYEKGINRISASRLFEVAKALGVDVNYFFETSAKEIDKEENNRNRLALELAKCFASISNRKYQVALVQMARALANKEKMDVEEENFA